MPGSRIGLALSGGGFRATFFHLGVIRFLRDAGLLPSISHITAVSGGSILAAHLVLNWDRYSGSAEAFEEAASEVVRFGQLDVRNRIVRRIPLGLPIHALRWLLRLSVARQLTRTGLLEHYYKTELYGDRCLFELPERPELHLLATNLGEGGLCSFTKGGVILQKRLPGKVFRYEDIHSGLAGLSLAVAASSAFPGFFPPLLVHGHRIGAVESQFRSQLFTDGGIYDNLGIRMFRNLERTSISQTRMLDIEDFYDFECVIKSVSDVSNTSDAVSDRLSKIFQKVTKGQKTDSPDAVMHALQQVLLNEELYRDDVLQIVRPEDPDAENMLKTVMTSGERLEKRDQIWLNRQILDAALRQATGKRCIRPHGSMFDAVIVSDAGKQFQAAGSVQAEGLIGTAIRATDILMDRVWQLELETFTAQPGFLFVSITDVVQSKIDPQAPNPEIQRQIAGIRTDLDCFSSLEISSLVQHGYCLARSRCKEINGLIPGDLPNTPPWDPIPKHTRRRAVWWNRPMDFSISRNQPSASTVTARVLRESSQRVIWSRLFDWRDWTSYVYLVVILAFLSIIPIGIIRFIRSQQESARVFEVMSVLTNGSEDYQRVRDLLSKATPTTFSTPIQEANELSPVSCQGWTVGSITEIYDDRETLNVSERDRRRYVVHRYRIRRSKDYREERIIRFDYEFGSQQVSMHSPNSELSPRFLRRRDHDSSQTKIQAEFDLKGLDSTSFIDLIVESIEFSPSFKINEGEGHSSSSIACPSGMLSNWILLPRDFRLRTFTVLEHAASGSSEETTPSFGRPQMGSSMLVWGLIEPHANSRYETFWTMERIPSWWNWIMRN